MHLNVCLEGSKHQLFSYDFNSPSEHFMGVGRSFCRGQGILVKGSVAAAPGRAENQRFTQSHLLHAPPLMTQTF